MKLPQFKSHKIVGAAKVQAISWIDESAVQLTLEGVESEFTVDSKEIDKHRPDVGWYLVRYEDGHISFSPAEAFENGYTKQPDYNWRPNTGERPADLLDLVNIRFRDGEIAKCVPVDKHGLEMGNWEMTGVDTDIVAYCDPTADEREEAAAMRQECEEVGVQCREAIEHAQRMIDLLRSKWGSRGYAAYLPSILGVIGDNISEEFECSSTNFCDHRLLSVGHSLIAKSSGGQVRGIAIPMEEFLARGEDALLDAVREITGDMKAPEGSTKH